MTLYIYIYIIVYIVNTLTEYLLIIVLYMLTKITIL